MISSALDLRQGRVCSKLGKEKEPQGFPLLWLFSGFRPPSVRPVKWTVARLQLYPKFRFALSQKTWCAAFLGLPYRDRGIWLLGAMNPDTRAVLIGLIP